MKDPPWKSISTGRFRLCTSVPHEVVATRVGFSLVGASDAGDAVEVMAEVATRFPSICATADLVLKAGVLAS